MFIFGAAFNRGRRLLHNVHFWCSVYSRAAFNQRNTVLVICSVGYSCILMCIQVFNVLRTLKYTWVCDYSIYLVFHVHCVVERKYVLQSE